MCMVGVELLYICMDCTFLVLLYYIFTNSEPIPEDTVAAGVNLLKECQTLVVSNEQSKQATKTNRDS